MTDMNELFHGKDIAEKAKLFDVELNAIDEKHKDFFKERKSHLPSREHDTIFSHCLIHTSNGIVTFNFIDNELPQYIKDDCIEAFKKVYPGSKQNPQ